MTAGDPRQALAQACAQAMWQDDHATRGLGIELEAVGPGTARLSMTVGPAMVNGHGMAHGGFLFALADSAFAFACNAHDERAVAAQCQIAYLRPVKLGERLTAEAVERFREGRSGITDVTVRGGDGQVVAEFRGHSRTIGGRLTG